MCVCVCVCVCVSVCLLSVGERTYQAKCVKAKLVKPEFQMLVQKCQHQNLKRASFLGAGWRDGAHIRK